MPVFDRETRRHDEETTREVGASRPANRVDGLPRDDHRHYRGFSGTRRELQGQPRKIGIGIPIRVRYVIDKPLSGLPELWSHLCKPDCGFHCLDLAKERTNIVELELTPMLEKRRSLPNACRLG
jgi:hypothetical protein